MDLTLDEKKVLACLEHHADQPISFIQKHTGMQIHKIRYLINKLEERGIILNKAPFINLYPLGFTDYTFYFSIASADTKSTLKFTDYLQNQEGISWLANISGDYQYGLSICASRIETVANVMQEINSSHKNIIQRKTLSARLKFYAFGRKYLWNKAPKKILQLGLNESSQQVEKVLHIDQLDQRILSQLANQKFTSMRDLARNLEMSFSTVERRIKILEEKQIIAGYIYRYYLQEYYVHTYRLLISVKNMTAETDRQIYELCEQHPQVIHLFICLGDWDYEIGIEVQIGEQISDIVQLLYNKLTQDILSIRTLQVFRHLKFSAYPFAIDK